MFDLILRFPMGSEYLFIAGPPPQVWSGGGKTSEALRKYPGEGRIFGVFNVFLLMFSLVKQGKTHCETD